MMKKNYMMGSFLIAGFFMSMNVSAQSPVIKKDIFQEKLQLQQFPGDKHTEDDLNSNRAVYWTEDFANGLAGNNSSTPSTWTTDGADGNIWTSATTLADGCYTTNSPDPSTATAGNGFMVFHVDEANCVNGTFNNQERTGYLVSPSIDLSAANSAVVKFQDELRHCCGDLILELSVSIDGGGSWTSYDVLEGLPANDGSAAPRNNTVNISALAANEADVMIRFDWNLSGAYYWAVDDISIEDAPVNDLKMSNVYWGSVGPQVGLVPYYQIPQDQITDIIFSSDVSNQGQADLDATLEVDVNMGAFTGTSATSTINSTAVDSLYTTANYTPSGLGTKDISIEAVATRADQVETFNMASLVAGSGYADASDVATTGGSGAGLTVDIVTTTGAVTTVNINNPGSGYTAGDVITIDAGNTDATIEVATVTDVVTDATPTNNSVQESIEVTNNVYARDNGTPDGGSFNGGDGYKLGNGFDIFTDATMYSIEFQVSGSSDASLGDILTYAELYTIDASGNFTYVAGSDEISITTNMISNEVTVSYPFPGGVQLTAGEFYMPVIGTYGNGGANNELVIMTAGSSEEQTSFLYDETDQTWYFTTSTPIVRMNFDEASAITNHENELDALVSQNIPNPFNNSSYINYTLEEAANVNFTVVDLSGKTIMSVDKGQQTQGVHRVDLNGSDFADGVYFYTFTIGDQSITKKMVVTK